MVAGGGGREEKEALLVEVEFVWETVLREMLAAVRLRVTNRRGRGPRRDMVSVGVFVGRG